MLEQSDDPGTIIFFATPDVLSGLFTLANYDEAEPNGVFCPFSAGCGSTCSIPISKKTPPAPGPSSVCSTCLPDPTFLKKR